MNQHILARMADRLHDLFVHHRHLAQNQQALAVSRVAERNTIIARLTGQLQLSARRGWSFARQRVRANLERQLDEIIDVNELDRLNNRTEEALPRTSVETHSAFGLPPCAQRMLAEGVTDYQRVACSRLAVQLKKAGLPEDVAVAALSAWALKNKPSGEKRLITELEIIAQVSGAYSKDYRSCGCGDPAVAPYCDSGCVLFPTRNGVTDSDSDSQREAPARES